MVVQTRAARRGGFSLVELLVVISLIAILAAMTAGGVGRARTAAIRAQAATEISQLSNAIGAFKAKYNVDHVPGSGSGSGGRFQLRGNYPSTGAPPLDSSDEAQYLKKLFPRLNLTLTGLPSLDLDANQCLVFFLSGGPLTTYGGFKGDPVAPFAPGGPGPFFDFPEGRMDSAPAGGGTFPQYLDPWRTPYAYFSSQGGLGYGASFSGTNRISNLATSVTAFTRNSRAEQQRGFQIVSAGPNGAESNAASPHGFGPGGAWSPGTGNYAPGTAGGDDLANFISGQLGYAQ